MVSKNKNIRTFINNETDKLHSFEILSEEAQLGDQDNKNCDYVIFIDDGKYKFLNAEKFNFIYTEIVTIDFPTAMQALVDGKNISCVGSDCYYRLSDNKASIFEFYKDNNRILSTLNQLLISTRMITSKEWYIIND